MLILIRIDTIVTLMSLILYFLNNNFTNFYFENGCWKVTAEILETEIKVFSILFFISL